MSEELLDNIYYIPREQIKMVVAGKSRGFLFYSSTGLGKTYQTRRTLVGEGLVEGQDFVFVRGHLSPLQFYKRLYAHSDKIVVVDDVNILENSETLNLLKAALDDSASNLVEFYTSKGHLGDTPSQFYFTGKLIVLLNNLPKDCDDFQAVNSRILHYYLRMDYNTRLIVLDVISQKEWGGFTAEQRLEIMDWIRESTNRATKNLSIRLLFLCYSFYKWTPRWREIALTYIDNQLPIPEGYIQLIMQNCSDELWQSETGRTIRTLQRYRQQLRQLGFNLPQTTQATN